MTNPQMSNTAVITGASAGIGALYADRLARRGYDLVLVARDTRRTGVLAERLRAETGRNIETFAADLGDKVQLRDLETLLRSRSDIVMLVNNAGVGGVTAMIDSDVEAMDAMINLNVRALTRLTYAAVPGFVARGEGTVVNIASIVAISPEFLNGVYGASKAYVLALTQSMHHELHDKGVKVQAVLPGATATGFWAKAGLPHENLPGGIVMDAAEMVDAALAGLDAGELVTLPALQDGSEWDRYDALRRDMSPRLSLSAVASRYRDDARS